MLDFLDFTFKIENLFRYDDILEMDSCADFIHHVDCFVGQVSIGDIPVAESDGLHRLPYHHNARRGVLRIYI